MKTTVVCGLLGSGKTTFIRNFLKDKREKTVVLVNDFGAAGIDGEIFSAGGIECIELPSGCVCCSLKSELVTIVKRIINEFSPDQLIIEPSGIASPSGVLEALRSMRISRISVIGLIDVTEFAELWASGMYGAFFEDQIINSDVILANKIDIAEEEKIVEAVHLIEAINPQAILFRTANAEVQDSLFRALSRERTEVRAGVDKYKKERFGGHFHFDTLSYRLKQGLEFEAVKKLFRELPSGRYGTIVRAKALVSTDCGPYRFDLVYGKVNCAAFGKNVEDNRIVIIGEKLNGDAFRRDFIDKEGYGNSLTRPDKS